MTKSCVECGKEIKLDWYVCPYCGNLILDQIRREVRYNQEKKLFYPIPILAHVRNRNFEFLILLMLKMNQIMTWSNFISEPLKIGQSTLSKYLSILTDHGFICRVNRGSYSITALGEERLKTLERINTRNPKSLDVWKQKREYELIILEVLKSPYLRDHAGKYIDLFKYTIQNDSSSQIIISIYKWLETQEEDYSLKLKKDIIKRYAKSYGVIEKEAKFFLDSERNSLESSIIRNDLYEAENLNLGDFGSYGIKMEREQESIYQNHSQNPYSPIELPGESHIGYVVKDGQVVALNYNLFENLIVPESINSLTELEYLIIEPKTRLPNTIRNLKKLHINRNPYLIKE